MQKHYSLKASLILILSGNLLLHEDPFRISNCLKSFDLKLRFVYSTKLDGGSLLAYLHINFDKHMNCFRAY